MERKEALEVVRKNMPTDRSLPVYEALQTLIPELRESEDEKIRKELVEKISNLACGCFISQEQKQKFITDLEKQKEHQFCSDAPNESSWSGIISSSDKDKNLDDIAQDYIEGVKEYNPEPTWDLMQTAVCYGYHLAENKQKPADLPAGFYVTLPDGEKYYAKEMRCKGMNVKVVEPKPAEWSEEDEKMKERLITRLTWITYNTRTDGTSPNITFFNEIAWLKSLPLQLKEAYKDGFQTARHATALTFMNYLDENRPEGKMSLSSGECEDIDKAFKENDWAKIMRYVKKYSPSWKPCEKKKKETLKVLDWAKEQWPIYFGWKPSEEQMKGGVAPMRDIDE